MLDYQHRGQVICTGSEWRLVREYHAQRGSQRRLVRLPPTPTDVRRSADGAQPGLDIQPGDIVLIDNAKGTFADHIAQCRSYDPATGQLETIGGNEGGGEGQIGVSRSPRDLNRNPAATRVAEREAKPSRVYAYGRFSLVDYEEHTYLRAMPADPHESPEAMAAARHGRRH
jgi:hypothetical protein